MKHARPHIAQAGISLVELLVSVVIGLVVTLAITAILIRSESTKRTTTTVNDINQTGAYVSYLLDRAVRSAGSGFTQRWQEVFGCIITASRDGTVILPRATQLPAPFADVSPTFRAAPVIVGKNQSAAGSDVIVVMSGTSGGGETPPRVRPASVTLNGLLLSNTLGIQGDELVLLAQNGMPQCMLQHVTDTFTGSSGQALPFSGRYYNPTGPGVQLTDYGAGADGAFAVMLGRASTNVPKLQAIGVGDNNTLFSYDILRLDGSDQPVPMAEGVLELRALYGVDSNGDGKQDAWMDPGAAPYDAATLMSGTATARTSLRSIVALRIGLILRTSLSERESVSPATVSLFRDLGAALQQDRGLTSDEQRFRHRTVEMTVPLRNMLLLPLL